MNLKYFTYSFAGLVTYDIIVLKNDSFFSFFACLIDYLTSYSFYGAKTSFLARKSMIDWRGVGFRLYIVTKDASYG